LPVGVVVSRCSDSERNCTPRAARPDSNSIRWARDRPSRSSRHTTSTSPAAQILSARARPVRLRAVRVILSSKVLAQPRPLARRYPCARFYPGRELASLTAPRRGEVAGAPGGLERFAYYRLTLETARVAPPAPLVA